MPYKSEQQRKWFHINENKKPGITSKVVKEYDKESKGKKLPRFAKLSQYLNKDNK